jgi:membrane protease YdiL (CAAX protease family)
VHITGTPLPSTILRLRQPGYGLSKVFVSKYLESPISSRTSPAHNKLLQWKIWPAASFPLSLAVSQMDRYVVNIDQASTQGTEAYNPKLKALAWSTIFIITIPQIVYRLLVSRMPGVPYHSNWLDGTEVAILAMLCLVTWIWPTARPLRGFFMAMLALFSGVFFIWPYANKTVSQLNWIQQASWGVQLVVLRTLLKHLVLIVPMVLTLIGSGIGQRELFLVRGNPSALFRWGQTPNEELTPWPRVIRSFLPWYIIVCVIVLALQVKPSMSQIANVLIFLPAILIAAAINAFGEEFEFRSMVLARLEPIFGGQSAIWMSSALFGLVHYFGTPGGPLGVVLAGFLGWLLAKSMIETRGFVWAFLLHFIADIMVFGGWATLI